MPLKCRLQGLGLGQLRLYPALQTWVANGEAIALNIGRGGAGTHTQPSVEILPIVVKRSVRKLQHESILDLFG